MEVLRALTSVNNDSMIDVIILAGNRRGAGAMKVARSIFEVSITAEYLAENPAETDLFLDFAHVVAWRHLKGFERMNPGKVPAEHKREAEAEYNRVKGKFIITSFGVARKRIANAPMTYAYTAVYGLNEQLTCGGFSGWVAFG